MRKRGRQEEKCSAVTGAVDAEQRELREAQQDVLPGHALVVHLDVQQVLVHHFKRDLLLPHGVCPAVLHNTPQQIVSGLLRGHGGKNRRPNLVSRSSLHDLDRLPVIPHYNPSTSKALHTREPNPPSPPETASHRGPSSPEIRRCSSRPCGPRGRSGPSPDPPPGSGCPPAEIESDGKAGSDTE